MEVGTHHPILASLKRKAEPPADTVVEHDNFAGVFRRRCWCCADAAAAGNRGVEALLSELASERPTGLLELEMTSDWNDGEKISLIVGKLTHIE